MNFENFIVIERQPRDLGESPEGGVFENRNVILVEIEMVELSEMAEAFGGNIVEIIVGQDEMLQVAGGRRQAVSGEAFQLWTKQIMAN